MKKRTSEERIVSQARTLEDLINYQENSIVSRTLIDKKAGTVTLFAFDQGQGLSEHIAPYDALIYALEGEVDVTISGNPIRLNKGETIIMPSGKPHALAAVSKFKMLLIMIRS